MAKKNKIQENSAEQEKLLQYLNRSMSDSEQHEFEKEHADDPFVDDAMEGLGKIKSAEKIDLMVHQLNSDLKKHIEKKRNRRKNQNVNQPTWVYFAIILILLILVISYLVIKQFS